MPRKVIYDTDSRLILVIDPVLKQNGQADLPTDRPCALIEISDSEAAKFAQPSGGFVLDPDGQTLNLLPVPPISPVEVELTSARSDIATQYQTAMTRLDQIIGNATPTNAQVVAAVQDMATIEKRLLRLVKNLLT